MKAKVTLGLCVKNAAKIVKIAFSSITTQDYPHELMKLVIVDNGSSDDTLSLAMKFAHEIDIRTLVTSSKGKGLAATRQIVVDNAEGDYIVWVDDDLELPKDFVRKQVMFMEKNPQVGAARGLNILVASKSKIMDIVEYVLLIPVGSIELKQIGTGASIFRLKALESVGGFDIQINGAGEDVDVSLRIRESGWLLAANNSVGVVQKFTPKTPKGLWKKNSWYGYGNHFLFHKFRDRRFLIEYFPPFTLLIGLKSSCSIYRVTGMKKVFVFVILHSFSMIAHNFGFIRAHLDGYGHRSEDV